MKNIDKIARLITKHGAGNLLIHSLPGTKYWMLCEKISCTQWLVSFCDPMGYSVYNLGIISNKQHVDLWMELVRREINIKAAAITVAKELRQCIRNFLKSRNQMYNKLS